MPRKDYDAMTKAELAAVREILDERTAAAPGRLVCRHGLGHGDRRRCGRLTGGDEPAFRMNWLLLGGLIGWLVASRSMYRRRCRRLELLLLAEVEQRNSEMAAAQDALAMMHEEAADGPIVVTFASTMFSSN